MKVILSETLKSKKISQYQLSKNTGIAASTLNNFCNNKTKGVDFNTLDKICEAINCTPNDILLPESQNTKGDTE